MRYLPEAKYRKYVKVYDFLSFGKIFGDKYGEKVTDTTIKTRIEAAETAFKRSRRLQKQQRI